MDSVCVLIRRGGGGGGGGGERERESRVLIWAVGKGGRNIRWRWKELSVEVCAVLLY
jgi:hypothetical protein